ncbi:MAG TPA: GNAT family N-acetyltransferase [Armatimonadota bacterium]|nr:GNAT family N-acetyltransferase [Armatimonadota bacterium]
MTGSPTSAGSTGPSGLEVAFQAEEGGSTRAYLEVDGRPVSSLWIVPFLLRVGESVVRMDGMAGVGTDEAFRNRGYSRRVLEATVEHMRQGDAALSMLYGIPDYYPKFGYATAGPDHFFCLTSLTEAASLPQGWRARPFVPDDLPAVRRLYEGNTAREVGAAVRAPEGKSWTKLAAEPAEGAPADCRVVENGQGEIVAYAWRAAWPWYTQVVQRQAPDALVIVEAMAEGPDAADAVLAACRAWAVEESRSRPQPVKDVLFALPPSGPVAAAAMQQSSRFIRKYDACAGSMARVLHVKRLLEALKPELSARLQASGSCFQGALLFRTELGDACLNLSPEGLTVVASGPTPAPGGAPALEVYLPQMALARLALGAFPPGDLLARLERPPVDEAARLLEALFPLRHPHMHLPDRF